MDSLFDLYLLERVISAGGFTAASRQIGLSKSRLSRRIARLEERLGVRLLQRDSRRVTPTIIGQVVVRHARRMIAEAELAKAAALEYLTEPSGLLRLSAPVFLGETVIGRLVAEFAALYPKVTVALELTSRLPDFVGEGIDVAIRVSSAPLSNSDVVLRKLSSISMILVASPGLLDEIGRPQDPGALASIPALVEGMANAVEPWTVLDAADKPAEFAVQPRLIINNEMALRQAALAGLGVARLPHFLCKADLGLGRLEQLLADWTVPPGIVYVAYPSRRSVMLPARCLIDFLAKRMPPHL